MQASALVRTVDVAATPWRNGGGLTRELLVRPAGDDWQLRVSVADVNGDGPFSAFAGVARWFAVLEGEGVLLTIDGTEHHCRAGDDALLFTGDAATSCRLLDGPTRDLNLMLRGVGGEMRRVVAGVPWRPGASECGLYATGAGRCRVEGDDPGDLGADDETPAQALRWWSPAPEVLAFDGEGWWLAADLERRP